MKFITYEDRKNPHVAIHEEGCNQLEKRGGKHKDGKQHYEKHNTYKDAIKYAQGVKLPIQNCSFCKPDK